MIRDHDGLHIPAAMPACSHQQTVVLRLLGRLEFMTTEQLHRLVYPQQSRDTVLYHLRDLASKELIWRVHVPFQVMPALSQRGRRGPPLKLPYVYGLTAAGRMVLETLDAEPDRRSLESLKARDPGSRTPSKLTMAHDLQASWWCSSLLLALRRSGFVRSIFLQVEFVVHERQRMDALIIIRLTRSAQPIDAERWPFFDGTPCRPDELEVRLALEVDRGTEPLPILLAKGAAYRDLHVQGTYNQAFGGPVLPVFLAPTSRRAGQIAREWQAIWPDGWGVISTPRGAVSLHDGVLWGDYRSLTSADPFPLLTVLTQHPITNIVQYERIFDQTRWQEGGPQDTQSPPA